MRESDHSGLPRLPSLSEWANVNSQLKVQLSLMKFSFNSPTEQEITDKKRQDCQHGDSLKLIGDLTHTASILYTTCFPCSSISES